MQPERVSEISEILLHAQSARAGKGNAVIVHSVSGMGCSELLGEVSTRLARSGSKVMSGACRPGDMTSQLSAVRQLVASFFELDGMDDSGTEGTLRRKILEGANLFDHRLCEELWADLVERARHRPLVFVVDHVQWMDGASLFWFGHMVRHLANSPIFLLLACRTDEARLHQRLTDDIAMRERSHVLTLRPLSGASARELVEHAYQQQECDEKFVRACVEATSGAPDYLAALLSALTAEGVPPLVSRSEQVRERGVLLLAEAAAGRLLRQPGDVQDVARTAAVLGEESDIDLIADLLDVHADTVSGLAAELTRVGVFLDTNTPRRLRFRHAGLRSLVHRSVAEGTRQELHMQAARRLNDLGAPLQQVAEHLLQAGVVDGTWEWGVLRDVAADSLRAGDVKACAEYSRRLLRLRIPAEGRAEALWLLGRAEALLSPVAASRHLEEAVRLFTDPARRAEAMVEAVYARALQQGSIESLLRPPLVGLAKLDGPALDGLGDTELTLRVRSLTQSVSARGTEAVLEALGRPALLHNYGVTYGEREMLASYVIDLAGRSEPRELPLELVHRLLPAEPSTRSACMVVLLRCITVLAWAGHLDESRRWSDHLLATAQEMEAVPLKVMALLRCSDIEMRSGNLPNALAHAEEALAIAGSHQEVKGYRATALSQVAAVCEVMGDYERAGSLFQGLHDLPVTALGVRGLVRLNTGDPRHALHDLLECGHRLEEMQISNPALSSWRSAAALAWKQLGKDSEARQLAEAEVELARQWGDPAVLGRSLRHLAAVTSGAESDRALEESVALLEQTGARLEFAHSLVAVGAAHARKGSLEEGRRALRKGIQLAEESGAEALAAQAHKELLASGGRLRRVPASGLPSLTPTELRIAQNAAQGSTNKAIADMLYMAPRTVEVHLTRVYRKLGIPGRGALLGALSEDSAEDVRDIAFRGAAC